jgi:MarR family transcriptional regulator, organic hydroperoxide resistance regulator
LLAARALVDRMRTLYRELERRTGAPIAMHRALACIAAEPGITASRLASALGMQRPALSHLLRSLGERGWVERRRSDSDQRSVRLHVTTAGRTVLSATSGRVAGRLQRAVHTLDDRTLAELASSLQALLLCLPDATPAPAGDGRR